MKIGILGTGGVGATIGTKLVSLGHHVKMGGRAKQNEKSAAWVAAAGDKASAGDYADAAAFGELLIVATAGQGTLEALAQAGAVLAAGRAGAGPARAEDAGVCGRSAEGFSAWLGTFRARAITEGISRETVSAALGDVRYDGGVVRLDRSQTPFKKTFEEFVETRLTPQRIAMGKRALTRHADLLAAIYKAYAVPGHVLVAIWGLETDFGAVSGDKPVFRSLATLAYDCRRAERFRGELLSALRIVDNGSLRVDEMRGAWAGELGQTQFLASSYEKYAVDFDGDGRADLLHSTADVLASTAHYLFQHNWLPDGDVGPGTANFVVLGSWNKSENYQRTIALFAQELVPADQRPKGKRRKTIRIAPEDER